MEDLGKVAEASSCKMRTLFPAPRLTVGGVFDELKAISVCSGKDSQQRKRDKIKKMLVGAKNSEAKYVIRFLQQRLRIGVQAATVYQALSYAAYLTRPASAGEKGLADRRRAEKRSLFEIEAGLASMDQAVRAALCELPNMDRIVKHLLDGCTAEELHEKCQLTPGIPVQPMLAKPTKGVQEVFDRFSNCTFTCEFKYDGERAQIHVLSPTDIRVFSRNLENLTQKYPDIIEIVKSTLRPDVTDCVLDSEVVAYDSEGDKILPFQILTTRKRKDVTIEEIKVSICLFPFDCMRYNGKVLLREPLKSRREYLHRSVSPLAGKLNFAIHKEMTSIEEVDAFLQEAVEGCCEGLMVKTLEESASYEPMKRSLNWLKIKKDYVDGLTDSVDLVPVGAFHGKGKRSGVYGAFLLAVWNPATESFQTACKAGTGFSDEILATHHASLKDKVISTKKSYYDVTEKMQPDVWLEACQVWECRAADLSISPVHTAAYGDRAPNKGIGLRFPRFIRMREDKDPEQATTSDQIASMYDNQASGGTVFPESSDEE